jgi:hypothetical protein
VLDPQDAINELLNCVLRTVGKRNGDSKWSTARLELVPASRHTLTFPLTESKELLD